MRLVTLAPAKVNLVLKVGPLRADGFHDLVSLLVPLDLGDGIEVRVAARAGPVTCRTPGHPDLAGPGNLAARAAEAFRRRFGVDRGVAVTIQKRTPVTAGLGGGSSDAAAVLRCLARAFGVRDAAALAEVGLAIGSDVPFFLGPGPAWAAGRGERLTPAEVPPLHLVLAYPRDPALAIRAGEAYRWLDEARAGRPAPRLRRPAGPFRPTQAGNDLQGGCVAHRPALGPLLGSLVGAGAEVALLSGSGPTVYGLFAGRAAARRAASAVQAVEGPGVRVLVARTVQRPPRVSPWRSPRSASSR
ncbi:MAG: 4-(cytidine 5'-diphospho)-2-C-methyl-D-erythritol kinase [Anaeromyxobacter sp.]|nr:4-(cytidine 5'-diphospho)-2-C-methyl-D-erythritol kinase [Anaeromyxobacter sp.]MBL0278182.1 4-(cytidine 5'-diphospho)-2-C-methyl-D-erythritol kinase [Anaeromyxobacter sp.]